ncbi:acyltransferase [Actinomadura sp. DC4]|uniref:acyltransferase family protein n=1 Tax=Actinomadura sp. DC4 TaxID=3055069 RepID=UPI0025B138C0|nr:acyltransferase [Actinomadura sp. DC4]MDN3359580.1 acyltransferase [Actinomadura sp. DC4]
MIESVRVDRAPPRVARTHTSVRIGAVDGLRAVAVAGVIAFHFGMGVPGGFLGVDLFFVISGYVITRLLLIEWRRTAAIDWKRFWARRARRLLPTVMALLVVVQLWLRLGALPELRATTDAQTVAALAYVSNWYAIFTNLGYWGALADATPLTHLWSLAVEEQFYLVWPPLLILIMTLTRSRRVLAMTAGAGAVVSYTAAAVLQGTDGVDRAYLGTDTRSGALLLGVLCALALTRDAPGPNGSWDRTLTGRRRALARSVFALALASLVALWTVGRIEAGWLYDGGLVLAGVSAALVIAYLVVAPGAVATRILAAGPVVWIGRLSYSLYLWHWPVHVYATHTAHPGGPAVIAAQLAVTLALGVLSFALIERPTRRIGRPMVLAPPLLACAVLVLGSAVLVRPAAPVEQQSDVTVHGRP